MLTLVKLIQSLVRALHSEGTPGQLAAGIALGSILGLTPLVNIHNAVVFALLVLLNVSFAGGMLGWALFVPLGFMLDPLFHWIGRTLLLDVPSLTPVWTSLYNMPVAPLTNFNNTVVLGSLVFALALVPRRTSPTTSAKRIPSATYSSLPGVASAESTPNASRLVSATGPVCR